jgi:sialic acid synthase SpsE
MTKVVAELSGSHGGDLLNCLKLIELAKGLKVDLVKFQVYRPSMLAVKRALCLTIPPSELLELYQANATPRDWWPEIMEVLDTYPWGASVFSEEDIEFILRYKPHYLKVASYELTDLALIDACARTRLPLVISVNHSATAQDVRAALSTATKYRHQPTFLMATAYWGAPTSWSKIKPALASEIQRYRWLREVLPPEIGLGLSDHLPPGRTAIVSYATGKHAVMVERHLRLASVTTADAPFSSNADEFAEFMGVIWGWDGKERQAVN